MPEEKPTDRLSQISTTWTMLLEAHDPAGEIGVARKQLFDRYEAAIRAYLTGALRDSDAAEECFQTFALRFIRGDFKGANPERGSFRKYLKTALLNLVRDYQRKEQRRPLALTPNLPEPLAAPPEGDGGEDGFQTRWRDDLVLGALKALEEWDQQTRQHLHTVLRLRMDQPDWTSEEMARHLAATVGKPLDSQWIRKRLHNARRKFAELLLDDVARTLEMPTVENVEEELVDLGLLEYCRAALKERRGS
jgi:RNA polymerase sigma-70 factor (ECF subfamily)